MGEKEYQNLADEPAHLHFDFWLNDIEGETLYGCIQHEINKCHEELLNLAAGRVPKEFPPADIGAYQQWFNGRIAFLAQLMEKLHHKREKK